jgi:hypothetical protein
MKKLLLALSLAALGVACRASGAGATDNSAANDCTGCTAEQIADSADCSDAAKAECSGAAASECSGEGAKVCPVTGKAME